jgi:hypothetical protein
MPLENPKRNAMGDHLQKSMVSSFIDFSKRFSKRFVTISFV